MRKFNWAEVQAPNKYLPAGAYVIEIQDVIDNEEWEQVEVVYNVTEGEYKDIYKNLAPDDDWKHKFSRKYDDRSERRFKEFLDELEHDNPSFTIERWQVDSDPLQFAGLKMGVLLGEWRYIYEDRQTGEEKAGSKLILTRPLTVEQVRSGEFDVPEPVYKRGTDDLLWLELRGEAASARPGASTGGDLYNDLPFS